MISPFARHNLNSLRRITQSATILLLAYIALSGLVSVDLDTQSLSFFGTRIWSHEPQLIIAGLLVTLAGFAGISLFGGRLFCGWLCPQTTLCELASATQHAVASSRRANPLRATALTIAALAGALLLGLAAALAIVGVFVPSGTLFGLLQGEVNTSLLKGITIVTLLLLVDVVVLRHTYCEWVCLFGWWQRLFGSNRSLRVVFDTNRGKDCTRCNGCKRVCFMGLDPRKRNLPSTCLDCGKCVTACDRELARTGKPGLISFSFGQMARTHADVTTQQTGALWIKAAIFGVFLLAVVAFGSWSIISRPAAAVRIRQEQSGMLSLAAGHARGEFYVDVYNNLSQPTTLELSESGLPQSAATIQPNVVTVAPRGRAQVELTLDAAGKDLHPGRNEIWVTAASATNPNDKFADRLIFGMPVGVADEY